MLVSKQTDYEVTDLTVLHERSEIEARLGHIHQGYWCKNLGTSIGCTKGYIFLFCEYILQRYNRSFTSSFEEHLIV